MSEQIAICLLIVAGCIAALACVYNIEFMGHRRLMLAFGVVAMLIAISFAIAAKSLMFTICMVFASFTFFQLSKKSPVS